MHTDPAPSAGHVSATGAADRFAAVASAPHPRDTNRIAALDVLRGVAVLGILLMNIPGMGQPLDAAFLPWLSAHTSADWTLWWVGELVIAGTQRGLLEMLFGAGMLILACRATSPAGPAAAVDIYYRRTLLLVMFGLVHALLLLWPGDILLIYGLAGLAICPLRRLRPRLLLTLGAAGLLVLQLGFGGVRYLERAHLAERVAAAQTRAAAHSAADRDALTAWSTLEKALRGDADKLAAERTARLGGYRSNLGWAANALREMYAGLGWLRGVGEAFFTMLIGAALFKWGVLQGDRTRRFYLLLLLAGYGIGVPLNALEAMQRDTPDPMPKLVWLSYDLSRMATTLGHIGLVCLLLSTGMGRRVLAPIRQTGRVAFTTYLGQTLICQFLLFPGFALALWGRCGLAELWAIAAAIITVQIVFAVLWLRYFRIGPFEWIWRSLSYRQAQPLVRARAPASAAARAG